jgi:excinuclease ABC subunit C
MILEMLEIPEMDELKQQIRNLPSSPGVYRYYDDEGNLLYIGKARNLKKRVSSYFTSRTDVTHRIRLMVHKIHRLEYTVTPSEYDALLLENSLIKEFQPKYNVSLKDDKTYPFLCIKNERFPRIFPTRTRIQDGSEYFGPYANIGSMKVVLELIRKLFPTRNCSYALTPENIEAGKFRVCLEYHIKLCKGPCQGFQTEEEYLHDIQQIRSILKGNMQEAVRYLKSKLQNAVLDLKFEEAQNLKERLELMEQFQARSTVVNPSIHDVDVFSIYSNEGFAFVNYLKVVNGAIITTDTIEVRKKLNEADEEVLTIAIAELRSKYNSDSREIIVPMPVEIKIGKTIFTVPMLGDKKKLLDMSRKNAFLHLQEKLKASELNKDKRKNTELLTMAKNDLGLKSVPYHIECFDNSNLQGTNPISAIVVFKNGVPSKKDYRFFNVRTVSDQPNDFATMEEAVFRRYRRLIEEEQALPQLIIIDGGKGQLNAALKSLRELKIEDMVDVIGIAKRLEEIYKPGDPLPLSINKKSPTLKLIQQARDEAHRFGITRHRKKRIVTNLVSTIEEIPGIGKKTTEKLLAHFKSVKKLRNAPYDDVVALIGKSRADAVFAFYHGKSGEQPIE